MSMQPKTLGRALGIGMRVAGKALLGGPPAGANAPAAPSSETAAELAEKTRLARARAVGQRGRAAGAGLEQSTRGVRRGARNFGRAVWNPFALATSVLWLEITGMFFALFACFFAQHLYQARRELDGMLGGGRHASPGQSQALLYAGLTVLFAYFSVSSFVRARRKARWQRSRR